MSILDDPFSYFYRPETDPTVTESGAKKWMSCPGSALTELRIPRKWAYQEAILESVMAGPPSWAERVMTQKYRAPAVSEEVREVGLRGDWPPMLVVDESSYVKGPRCAVHADGAEVGSLPRGGLGVGNACHFRVRVDGQSYHDACFVLPYQLVWSDDGWNAERVLDATGVDLDLLRRIPGWLSS